MSMRLRWNHDRFALGQNRSARRSLRVPRAQMLVILEFPIQQPLRIGGGDPSALLGNADRHNFVFVFVDGVEDRCGRQQRDLMLSTASAKQNADSKFFHDSSVWTRVALRVNRRVGSQLLES